MGGPTAILRFFEGVEQVDERREVDAAAVLRRGDARTQREMCLPDARRAEQDDILFAFEKAEHM